MPADVLYIDDCQELREIIPELIRYNLNRTCLSLSGLSQIKEKFSSGHSCKVVILDIDLGPGQPSGIDIFQWLQSQGFKGKMFFLTGHGMSHPFSQEAKKLGIQIFEKPLHSKILLESVRQGLDLNVAG
ncbi:MAG: response regulator [Pseudobdellovibrionaceae bacterium]